MGNFDFDFSYTEYINICKEAMFGPDDRKILECKIKGLTYVEIGNECGMSPDNVKKRIAKIKEKIKKVLKIR